MAMTVVLNQLTGAGPTSTPISLAKWNREDTNAGATSGIPVPSATGTNFSWIKSFQVEITNTDSLTMTNIKVGKVANETVTGTKLWHVTSHAVGAYVEASSAPSATGDNNVTAPTLNSASATAVPLISAPPSAYAAGPFSSTAAVGNLVEVALGVDNTCSTAGTGVAAPTLRWQWTEA